MRLRRYHTRRLRGLGLVRPDRACCTSASRHISWFFVSITSFTTYALSHNIGASVFSGALVRYRAYTSKGLSAPQIAVLVALCSFTFGLGTIFLGGLVLTIDPTLLQRLDGLLPGALTNPATARAVGLSSSAFVVLYVIGSVLHLRPITIRKFKLEYPRPAVMVRQLIAAPLELLGAAGIIYFVMPAPLEPSFIVVLAVFLASFSAALVSHAPGGLGVFELVFLTAMPDSEAGRARGADHLPPLLSADAVRAVDRGRPLVRAGPSRAGLAQSDRRGASRALCSDP